MRSFAERMGHRATRSIVQSDSLDRDTRVELWNVLHGLRDIVTTARQRDYSETEKNLLRAIWTWVWKSPSDEQPTTDNVWQGIKDDILSAEWFDALDTIESVLKYTKRYEDGATAGLADAVIDALNNRFEEYMVGYRFINDEITPIDSTAEADAVAEALDEANSIQGARHHLERAVELLADRQNPDYPNSIKESISAVEAVCRMLTGEKTLGKSLGKLKSAGVQAHPALAGGWDKLYGWTSDDKGVRHAAVDTPDADQALAKYMLVTCSAFVSYLIEAGRKAELI